MGRSVVGCRDGRGHVRGLVLEFSSRGCLEEAIRLGGAPLTLDAAAAAVLLAGSLGRKWCSASEIHSAIAQQMFTQGGMRLSAF